MAKESDTAAGCNNNTGKYGAQTELTLASNTNQIR